MNQLNQTILEGNIVNDIDVDEQTAGLKTGKFTVAVNRNFRNANGETGIEVSYFDCETYGEYAAKIQGKCVKGAGVRIVGRLKQNRWKDGGGKICSKVFVVVEHIDFLKKSAGKEENL